MYIYIYIYYGERYLISYTGNYNLNLDNSIVFGVEREDDQIGYNKDLSGRENKHNYVTSNFFDLQSRLTNNIFFRAKSFYFFHTQ